MRLLTGLLVVLLLAISESVIAAGSPSEIRESGKCDPETWPETWALSATKDWVAWTCRYAGGGLVDDFSRHTRVFIAPARDDANGSLSILARHWSVAPADDALWYVDERGTVRRLVLHQSPLAEACGAAPGLDLKPAEPWTIIGLSASAAVVGISDAEGPGSICEIKHERGGIEIRQCIPSATERYWSDSSPISAGVFVVTHRLGDWSYNIEYWQIDPLARRWVRNLPVGVQPRSILPGREGGFLVVGCASEAPSPPFLGVFDSAGAMEIVDATSENCTFGLLNPCPAVVGGVWEDEKWKVWLWPGPSGSDLEGLLDLEELHVGSSGAECFPKALQEGAQPADSKAQ